jgi:hypothetical protein
MSYRETATSVHGLLFGVFFLLACYALALDRVRELLSVPSKVPSPLRFHVERIYLVLTAVLGWAAVLTGTYWIYPWYRAPLWPSSPDSHLHSRAMLLMNPVTAPWHSVGMEWKEHVAFLAPIAFTMVAYVWCRYPLQLRAHPLIRVALLVFAMTAVFATGTAAFVGAFLNKLAPVIGN